MFKLQWHSPDPKYFKLWERQIGRKNFKVTKNTKVCSNHFVFGKPLGKHLHPELWLRGYDSDKAATLNVNAAEAIDTWSNGDKQDESVYKLCGKNFSMAALPSDAWFRPIKSRSPICLAF